MVTYDENLLQAEQDKIEKVYTAIGVTVNFPI